MRQYKISPMYVPINSQPLDFHWRPCVHLSIFIQRSRFKLIFGRKDPRRSIKLPSQIVPKQRRWHMVKILNDDNTLHHQIRVHWSLYNGFGGLSSLHSLTLLLMHWSALKGCQGRFGLFSQKDQQRWELDGKYRSRDVNLAVRPDSKLDCVWPRWCVVHSSPPN